MTLQLQHATFAYGQGDRTVIDGVSAEVASGRITAIIGPNAAGKSTLVRLMAGLLAPRAGRVLLDDAEAHRLDPRQRAARVAYVPQRPRIDAPFTTVEAVALGRFAQPRRAGAVEAALAECGLLDERDRILNTLSTGQQQRAALARALAQVHERDDAILLLDEPTSALDPLHVLQTSAILRRSALRGRAVVVVLHDLVLARRLSDDTWIMHAGRLLAAGPTADICTPNRLEEAYGVRFAPAPEALVAQGE